MAIKKLFASLGIGGASVETVLAEPNVLPGGVVHGEVRVVGGSVAQSVQQLSVGLQARVEVESGNGERAEDVVFHRQPLGGSFELPPGAAYVLPFAMNVPWETPLTSVLGQCLVGVRIGVTTQLEIARALDSTDLDPIVVHPLAAQQALIDAFGALGFRFKSADLEKGRIGGTRQRLPFYQEIEFAAPVRYRGLQEVELSFLADGQGMDVVLEMDKLPGVFTSSSDTYRCFQMDLAHFQQTDWASHLNHWLAEMAGRRKWF